MTDDDLTALERNAAGVPWVAELVAEVRRLRAAVAWHERELAAERAGVLLTEGVEQKLLADRGIRREPKSTPAVTLAAEVDRLRAAVAAERAWAAGVADGVMAGYARQRDECYAKGWNSIGVAHDARQQVAQYIAAAIRRGPEPTEGV